jgi:hypothetical protein
MALWMACLIEEPPLSLIGGQEIQLAHNNPKSATKFANRTQRIQNDDDESAKLTALKRPAPAVQFCPSALPFNNLAGEKIGPQRSLPLSVRFFVQISIMPGL